MIVMLDCLKVNTEVLDISMETIGSSEYKELLEIDKVNNCHGNHQSQRPMTTQRANLLVRYNMGSSQENSTRSIC